MLLHLSRRRVIWGTAVVWMMTTLATVGTAQKLAKPERFFGLAVGLSRPAGGAQTVEIVIERWTTDAERDHLTAVLRKDGPAALLEEMVDLPRAGLLRTPESLGYPLQFARRRVLPDKTEQITLITDRPITFWGPSNLAYPFTLVELRIGPDGKGEGRLSLAANIDADDRTGSIVLENYPTLPVQLTGVRRESSK